MKRAKDFFFLTSQLPDIMMPTEVCRHYETVNSSFQLLGYQVAI